MWFKLVSIEKLLALSTILFSTGSHLLQDSIPFAAVDRKFRRSLLNKDHAPDDFDTSGIDHNVMHNIIYRAFNHSKSVLGCPISTKSCGNLAETSDYKVGSLGNCVYVGAGDKLLKYKYGKDIDLFDTIFRIGYYPVKKYKRHNGSRTDVLLVRTPLHLKEQTNEEALHSDAGAWRFRYSEHQPNKFYLAYPSSCPVPQSMQVTVLKLKLLSHTVENVVHTCPKAAKDERFETWYSGFKSRKSHEAVVRSFTMPLQKFRILSKETKKSSKADKWKNIVFTHGFELILAILNSNLCSNLSVYGFSKQPGYHYFVKEKKSDTRVRPGHVIGLEFYILQQLLEEGLLYKLEAYE
jgi:hypothetical protein